MQIKPTVSNAEVNTKEKLEEALSVLEAETAKRIEEIRQHMETICESIRTLGQEQIKNILSGIRELSVEEFCDTYGADMDLYLSRQNKSVNRMKRRADSQSEDEGGTNKKKFKEDNTEKSLKDSATEDKDVGPLVVEIERENQPVVCLPLDIQTAEIGQLKLKIPNEILSLLNDVQRSRIRDQIQAFQDKLDELKQSL